MKQLQVVVPIYFPSQGLIILYYLDDPLLDSDLLVLSQISVIVLYPA